MRVIYNSCDAESFNEASGVGLGNFDGVHIGHMALINTLIGESRLNGLKSIVYTFTKHPENILRKKLLTPLITTVNKKVSLLKETPLDYLYFDEFDERYSRMDPEAFAGEILADKLKAKLAVAGFDYRFGYRGEGDVRLLEELGRRFGFRVIVIPPVKIDNSIVSSTMIRQKLARGDMERVFKLLGRHYSITGTVTGGRRIGSRIGFPTANIHPEDYLIIPQNGVYVTKTLLDGKLYGGVTNIGKNPTFGDSDAISVETHILDFDEDIYNKSIEVFFLVKIRNERRYSSKEALIERIKKDVDFSRSFLG